MEQKKTELIVLFTTKLGKYLLFSACRHGNYCARLHNRPSNSRTLLFINLYKNPALDNPVDNDGIPKPLNPCNFQNHFEVIKNYIELL